jgi:hypothetical protein
MNVEIGTETPIFLFWDYLFRKLGILSLLCMSVSDLFIPTFGPPIFLQQNRRPIGEMYKSLTEK